MSKESEVRLIDANALVKVLKEELDSEDCRGFWNTTVNSLIKIIESAPTVPEQNNEISNTQ